jgi:large subunit ribosomal protein L21
MYAIVDIAGQQLKVEKNQKVFVHRLDAEEGSKVDFDKVLLVDNEGKVDIGVPIVKDMIVRATVLNHLKGDKVKVFKKKRRKGYKKLNGHRQYLTEILIEDIAVGKAEKKATAEKPKKATTAEVEDKAAKPKAEKKEVSKTEPKASAPTEKKTTAEKKPAAKKTTSAAKKTVAAKESKPDSKKEDSTAKPAAKKAEPKKDKTEE